MRKYLAQKMLATETGGVTQRINKSQFIQGELFIGMNFDTIIYVCKSSVADEKKVDLAKEKCCHLLKSFKVYIFKQV